MLEILIDIAAILMAIIGIVGCVIPALPGPPLAYASLLLLYLTNNPGNEITGRFLIIWIVITAAVTILDYVVQPYFTKITGGSKLAVRYSIAGMVAGMVFFPPFGIVIGSFLGASLYVKIIEEMGKPQLLWLIFTGIGILSIVGLLVYNKVVNKK